jgi:hypothetical protein
MDMASMYLGDSAMGDRILAYGENGDASSNVLFSSGTLRRLFFFGLIIYSIDKIEATERLKQIILWGAFLSIVTYLLFSQIGYFSIRLSAYYRIIECIWLSYFPFIFKNHRSQMIVIAFFFLYSILQVSSALMLEDNGLQVGERGSNLSVGQRHLVALARALINNPPILILDEPTTGLDVGLEKTLISHMKQVLENKTLIVITHRFAALDLVDRIIVLNQGKVVADGPKNLVLASLQEKR